MIDKLGELTSKDRIAIIYMPIVIVVLTALLGTGIGIWLQNRSFKRNELFRAKLERIMSAQKDAVEIMRGVDEARKQLGSDENFVREQIGLAPDSESRTKAKSFYSKRDQFAISMATLKESKAKLEALGTYTSTLSADSTASSAIESYSKELQGILECVEEDKDFEKNCSDEHPDLMKSLREIVIAYAKMADGLIDKYD